MIRVALVALLAVAGLPVAAAQTAAQDSNHNVVVTLADDDPQLLTCGSLTYFNTTVLGTGNPLKWEKVGVPVRNLSGITERYDDGPAFADISPSGGVLPLDDKGALVIIKTKDYVAYSIYQLRNKIVPADLPTPLASGVISEIENNPVRQGSGNIRTYYSYKYTTVPVNLQDGAGDVIMVRFVDNNGDVVTTSSPVAQRTFAAEAPVIAVAPYGHLKNTGGIQTVFPHSPSTFIKSGGSVTYQTGDVGFGMPTGAMVGTRVHETTPTITRTGIGEASLVRAMSASHTTTFPTTSHFSVYTPVYDADNPTTEIDRSKIFVPHYNIVNVPSPLSCTLGDLVWVPSTVDGRSLTGDIRTASTTPYSLTYTPPTAVTTAKPVVGWFTGGLNLDVVNEIIPGTGGNVVLATDIFTPMFPASPPPKSEPAFGRYGTYNQGPNGGGVFAELPTPQLENGSSCMLTSQLFPGGYPSSKDSFPDYTYYNWRGHDDLGLPDGIYKVRCTVGLSSGTTTQTTTVNLGTPGVIGPGGQQAITAYETNQLGWQTDNDFMGLGLLGVMALLSSMVGFNRKHLPSAAVIFVVMIAAFGFFGILTVPETVMGAMVVVVILMVFQRQGGR